MDIFNPSWFNFFIMNGIFLVLALIVFAIGVAAFQNNGKIIALISFISLPIIRIASILANAYVIYRFFATGLHNDANFWMWILIFFYFSAIFGGFSQSNNSLKTN